ncbi:MAG: ABC transporter substrate-binding protein [Nitrososphaerota archaeon]
MSEEKKEEKMDRRKYIKYIGAGAVVAGAAAAIGYGISELTKPPPPTPTTVVTTVPAPTTVVTTAPQPTTVVTTAVMPTTVVTTVPYTWDGTIKVGTLLGVTGQWSVEEWACAHALYIAAEEINEAGGFVIKGKRYKIDIIIYDTEGKAEKGVELVERAATIDKINVGVGAYMSSMFLRCMDLIEKYKIPYITTVTTSSQIPRRIKEEKMKYIFSTSPIADDRGVTMAQCVAHYYKPKKVAILSMNDEPSLDAMSAFKNTSSSLISDIKFSEYLVEQGTTDFTPELTSIKAEKPDLLLLIIGGTGCWSVVNQWKELDMRIPVAAMFGSFVDPRWAAETSPTNELWIAEIVFKRGPVTPLSMPFIEKMEKKYGYWTRAASQTYDGALAMFEAIKKANSLEPDAIAEALLNVNIMGVLGPIYFEKDTHRRPYATLEVGQIRNGKHLIIWPQELKETDFVPMTFS